MFLTRAERRRVRRRRRLFLLCAVVVALAAIASALDHTHARSGHRSHTPGRDASMAARAAAAKSAERRVAPTSAGILAGTGLDWADFHGIQLPESTAVGPRHSRGGLAWGFVDTQEGALLAAVNIAVRTAAQWGPGIYQPTIRHQVIGPDAAALLKADASGYASLRAAAHVHLGQPAGRGYAVEAGFRFVAYTLADATVDIVTEGPGGGGTTVRTATRVEVVWLRGDWRVVAPPGGDWANSATAVSSLIGYTTFPNEG
jgi:hypothetical protein